jgi:hypothetical protein
MANLGYTGIPVYLVSRETYIHGARCFINLSWLQPTAAHPEYWDNLALAWQSSGTRMETAWNGDLTTRTLEEILVLLFGKGCTRGLCGFHQNNWFTNHMWVSSTEIDQYRRCG